MYSAEVVSESDVEDIEESLNLIGLNNYKPVSLPIFIDDIVLKMEVDTGTAISCINNCTYERYFSHHILMNDDTILKFYDGTKIKPLGIIRPRVRFQGQEKNLELFVIKNGTTSLIGRQWLADLQIKIPVLTCTRKGVNNMNFVQINEGIKNILDRYKELFSGGLGRYRGGKATLRVRPGATPVFQRARPVPYALRERIDAELDGMLRDGVIEPVDCSDWASPLVPVTKADGTLRICADYKATLNPALLIDRYPLPKIEDVLVGLNGAQYFSKIDLSRAYNQVELDDSKKYTVINTHRGLFQYNRLVYGLSSSVGIFQRIMTNLLGNLPNVQVFLDDVIISGKNKSEHLHALEQVLQRLSESGLKLKQEKCVFLVDEVTYLGYVVSKEGVKADKSKIKAISKLEAPNNISELRSFIGMVNFFSKFIKNFSSVLVPLHRLLRKGVDWNWDEQCERAFIQIKQALMSTEVLAHYDPNKPLIVTCDASARGVGGVLAQPGAQGERPIAYASRTLTIAEKNYSQIHREALAIIFSVRKFHQYIYGRKFILRTDHKPLVSILGPQTGIPAMTASRMQRWAVILSAYNYDIEYIRTNENCADGLSRLPETNSVKNVKEESIPEQTYLHFAQDGLLLDYSQIKKQTERDPLLSRILNYLRDGWSDRCEIVNLQPYFNRKAELYEELGCVMWGHRVVIPERCRNKVLTIIHEPHMGIVKSKALARSYVWWPGIDEAVERECRACTVCAAYADDPPRASPRPWPWPAKPWSRLHLDFMGPIGGKTYLVIVDSTSKWLEVFQVPSTAASHTMMRLRELWSRWGIPRQIVTDNGPPFTSGEFAQFIQSDGIQHIFTAPYHPSSNGAAENAVKTLKRVVKKANLDNKSVEQALNTFLLYYRNTEHCTTGISPSVALIGRRLRTKLDVLKPDVGVRIQKVQQGQVDCARGTERRVEVGDDIWYRQYLKGEKWQPGTIVNSTGPSNYKVLDSNGKPVHRHIDQLRRRTRSSLVVPTDWSRSPEASAPTSPLEGRSERPEVSVASSPPQTNDQTDQDTVAEEFSSPPSIPVPPQSRPIRKCRFNKDVNYKI